MVEEGTTYSALNWILAGRPRFWSLSRDPLEHSLPRPMLPTQGFYSILVRCSLFCQVRVSREMANRGDVHFVSCLAPSQQSGL